MRFEAKNTEDLIKISKDFLTYTEGYNVFAFEGEMGAGKTTFIAQVLKAMGITDEVSSPTYGYVNEHHSPYYGKIYHFDLYRIENIEEAYDIGIEEYLYNDAYVFIEWAEKIYNLLPESCVWIKIKVEKDDLRSIEVNIP